MSLMRSLLLAGSQSAWLRDRAMHHPFVRRSVARFMPGETVEAAIDAARQVQARGASSVVTRLGENVADVSEADQVAAHYRDVIARVGAAGLDVQVSVKPTQLGLDLDLETCFRHLAALVELAERTGNFVWIDMESTKYVDLTLELFRRARARSSRVGVCLQAYLRRTFDDLESLLPLGPAIRLVKGAYREPPSLAYAGKRKVDENYFELASRLCEDDAQRAGATVAIGTHDEELIRRLVAQASSHEVRPAGRDHAGGYEFEMLFGIQRGVQARLLSHHQPLRILISYGEYWFPWYMRRLAERPANVWFVARSILRG
ncbi:MAG: proline dehydrogenase family protein [Bacteroidales bacterium]